MYSSTPCHHEEPELTAYDLQLLASVQKRFHQVVGDGEPLFTTNVPNLWRTFHSNLPLELKQPYNCRACRDFVQKFGGLVTIDPNGVTTSVMWQAASLKGPFQKAIQELKQYVEYATVTGIFLSEEIIWGVPRNYDDKIGREREHFAVLVPESRVHQPSLTETTSQLVARRLEEYKMLQRGLVDYSIGNLTQAVNMLSSGSLARSEKGLPVAKWLQKLKVDIHNARSKDNTLWLAVASAPAGFCHISSGMIGTLLDDIKQGYLFSNVKARWDQKMDPTQYMRPQAPPKAGNIDQAERIVAKLAAEGALHRRFARLLEVPKLWTPRGRVSASSNGVFSHLRPRPLPGMTIPPSTMTFEKFRRTVMEEAVLIEYLVTKHRLSYSALVAPMSPGATKIIQWDNQFSWYVYAGNKERFIPSGSLPGDWNLQQGDYVQVTGITLQPSMWEKEDGFSHQGKGVFLLLEGAKDMRYQRGAGFFPELLRNEFHAIRATMGAYANEAMIARCLPGTPQAAGLYLREGATWNAPTLRVTKVDGSQHIIFLDRWD